MGKDDVRGALERTMGAPLSSFRELALSLPDDPLLVETRGMLLSGRCRVLRDGPASAQFIVADSATPLVSIVGKPRASLIQLAVTGGQSDTEVIAGDASIEHVAHALPDWLGDEVIVMTRADEERCASRPSTEVDRSELRILRAGDVELLETVPTPLRRELSQALARGIPVAACFVDRRPVSFCYPGYVTERWWDVSVDTLAAYRGRGLAAVAFGRMAEWLAPQGRAAVWGALDSNLASLRAAEKLGFRRAGGLALFRRQDCNTER